MEEALKQTVIPVGGRPHVACDEDRYDKCIHRNDTRHDHGN